MKRYVIAAITCIALTVGVSPAAASGGLGGVVQTLTGTSQQNANTAGDASAVNANGTSQSNDQSQMAYGGDASTGDASTGGAGCCGSGDATSGDAYGGDVDQSQEASNTNSTSQEASAESTAVQVLPVNVAVPICVGVYCKTGDVEQSNTNTSGDARAGNASQAGQSNLQSQTGTGGNATSGDAESRGCCKPGWQHESKPGPRLCGHPEPKPKPKPCKPEHAGDARTGDATGGDVTQAQTATNAIDTAQTGRAASIAKQEGVLNLVLAPVCPKPAPKPESHGCKPC
jgi:hypothetical protein